MVLTCLETFLMRRKQDCTTTIKLGTSGVVQKSGFLKAKG